ncbi:uncharacterized protein RHOBADRAFT_51936 [Rhodotorula graminis WP1]|uniref:Transmembrane protein 135 N-terminal domain-containing protein n=1 Tax=Rhodotorula graminis (strain WP1) TaxID=578459 RepID=A0A194SC40_RHOGW|nr:uncharacterized protein RHOBADRAFT_51936 [Rhodotorula graminis WP1]KPV76961.1 hypothetical protein RHOBADRAFT_51936 [Rhodotorula graminis WP1]
MADPTNSPPSQPASPLPSTPSSPHTGTARSVSFTNRDHSPDSTRTASPEPLATPTLAQSYGQLRKSLSLSNLAQLDREGVRNLSTHIYRRGSRIDRRQYRPKDDDEVLAHALRGGIRSLILGSSLRAAVNFAILVLRLTRKRGLSSKLILHALFGTDVIRFGSMLGLFTFLYKWTLHTLRLYNPGARGPSHFEPWHAAIAGLVSGLAVVAEKPSRRVTIGQQLFVRGLQGRYNDLKARDKIRVKNVSVIVFGLSCAQIMYAWLMAPEALPSGYRRWITQASRVSEPCLPVNLSAYRTGTFDPDTARKALTWGRGATALSAARIEAYAHAAEHDGEFGPPFAPCAVVHPWMDSCTWNGVDRWQHVFRWIAPVYAGLHFVPPLLFRSKAWMKRPSTFLLKSLLGTLRSCSFLASFVTLFQGLVCLQRHIYLSPRVPPWIRQLVVHKAWYWFAGLSTGLPLFIEEKKRRRELAMYVLPRGLESVWSVLRAKSYVPFVPGGEVLLTSLGLAMVMQSYQSSPEHLSGLMRSLLYQSVSLS